MGQLKTLYFKNRRYQFVESEHYASYIEKRFVKGICITFKSEEIWTIEEGCSNSNSKEKEVQSFVLCVDQLIDCQQARGRKTLLSSFRKGCDRNNYHCSSVGFVWKSKSFHACFCTACYCFSHNNLCRGVLHELFSVWRLCIISKFCKGVF